LEKHSNSGFEIATSGVAKAGEWADHLPRGDTLMVSKENCIRIKKKERFTSDYDDLM